MICFQCPVHIFYASVFFEVYVLSLNVFSQLKMTSKMRFCHSCLTVKVTEENVSETGDNVEEDPDYEESSSDENETSGANVIKMVPGPTRYTVSNVQDIKSEFELFVTPSVESHKYLR